MKKISVVMTIGVFLFLAIFSANAQQQAGIQVKTIEPYKLNIAYSKTTNIIFPHAIISVDRGSKDVLAQKAKGVENILQVKAARDSFPETNLTVVTADGRLNSFILNYTQQPTVLNISLSGTPKGNVIFLSPENVNQAQIQSYAQASAASKKKVRGVKDKDFGIRFQMSGLFIQDEVLYVRLNIENRSNVNYDIDQLRFFIRDQKKASRTATQEIEITPVHVENNTDKVDGNSQQTMVFALPKFTIPDKKYLAVQLMEKNGGRHLELHVKNNTIVKATVLPAL
ncbi:conjugative transposon protein TraN [Pedobacter sp. ISL-68]|uniref:conjugative transposon protein TraN n=1 Tax=Pedobacter sp. ISL-68 TaxID=2819165 RepID=UPI001BECF5D9|nr:conjugative transposon protein TraN [Pedobacter sp. ISL-68]MBT2591403.1 conjugative transposon protein TraN [Pedobacter sp. ISL-68]